MAQGSKVLYADGRRTSKRSFRLDSAAIAKLLHARSVLEVLNANITDSTLVRMALSLLITEVVDPTIESINEGRDDGTLLARTATAFNNNDADGTDLLPLRDHSLGRMRLYNERRTVASLDKERKTLEEQHNSMLRDFYFKR